MNGRKIVFPLRQSHCSRQKIAVRIRKSLSAVIEEQLQANSVCEARREEFWPGRAAQTR
jgi:hypothetical protein